MYSRKHLSNLFINPLALRTRTKDIIRCNRRLSHSIPISSFRLCSLKLIILLLLLRSLCRLTKPLYHRNQLNRRWSNLLRLLHHSHSNNNNYNSLLSSVPTIAIISIPPTPSISKGETNCCAMLLVSMVKETRTLICSSLV